MSSRNFARNVGKFPKYIVPLSLFGTAYGIYVLFRGKSKDDDYDGPERLAGRTVVITGTTSGIGRETATQLADKGARLIMGCRDMKKCEEVRKEIIEKTFNQQVTCKHLDLTSLKSVRKFAKDIVENEKRLDILINNAGVMGLKERTLTEDGFEEHLAVNHLSPFLLTNLLLDKLEQSDAGRIIYLTIINIRENNAVDFNNLNCTIKYSAEHAYYLSKKISAQCGAYLYDKLQESNSTTRLYFVYPGMTKSGLGRHTPAYSTAFGRATMGKTLDMFLGTPRQGAKVVVYCALTPELPSKRLHYYHGNRNMDFSQMLRGETTIRRLWAVSDYWTQERDETTTPSTTIPTATTTQPAEDNPRDS